MSKLINRRLSAILGVAIALSCKNPESHVLGRDASEPAVATANASEPLSPRQQTSSRNVETDSGTGLVVSRVLGGSDTFGKVQEIRPVGDYIVVTDRGGSPHVTVFDRASGQIVRRFGASGRGPREFRGVYWLFTESHDPPRVWLWDYMNIRASLLDLDAPDSLLIADQFRVEVAAQITSPAILGDTIVAGGFYADMVLLTFDRDQNVLSRVVGDLPYTEDDVEVAVALQMLNMNSIAFDPSRTRAAIAYQRVNRVDMFRMNGTQLASGVSPRTIPPPKYQFSPSGTFLWEEMTPTYVDVDASDSYVYALFKGSQSIGEREARLSYRVDVFTWDGEYVTELFLDHDLNEIAVTQDDSLLYGAAQEPFPAVVEWNLPAWLRERVRGSRE